MAVRRGRRRRLAKALYGNGNVFAGKEEGFIDEQVIGNLYARAFTAEESAAGRSGTAASLEKRWL